MMTGAVRSGVTHWDPEGLALTLTALPPLLLGTVSTPVLARFTVLLEEPNINASSWDVAATRFKTVRAKTPTIIIKQEERGGRCWEKASHRCET